MATPRQGRPLEQVIVSPSERVTLEQWTRRRWKAQGLAQRARIVLAGLTGRNDTEVGRELRLTPQTVGRWRRRFQQDRLDGLLDEPRPRAPRRITDAVIERVITNTLKRRRAMRRTGSTPAMAKTSEGSPRRRWRALGRRLPSAAPRGDVQALERSTLHR
jgi:transposase-like protein